MPYTITEIIPPAGYIGAADSQEVTPEPFSEDNVVTFVNKLGSVKFLKNYEGAAGLPVDGGAVFRIYRETDGNTGFTNADENFTVKDDIKDTESSGGDVDDANNATGVIKVNDLKTGSYLIKEISAPTGWSSDPLEVSFSIPGTGGAADVELTSTSGPDQVFDNPRVKYDLTVEKKAIGSEALIDGAVFELYKENGAAAGLQITGQANADQSLGTCTTGALAGNSDDGKCTIANLAWGATYYWYEVSVPAPYNLPNEAGRKSGPITINADGTTTPAGNRTFTFHDPKSTIRTQATNGNLPDATISDSAWVGNLNSNNNGSVTFYVYGPFTAAADITSTSCAYTSPGGVPDYDSGPKYVASATDATGVLTGSEYKYESGAVSVSSAGYYAWIAVYSGDNNGNSPVAGACGDANETSHVEPGKPGITTVAKAVGDDLTLPGVTLFDTAKVTPVTGNLDVTDDPAVPGVDAAHVNFYLYGPNDTTCSNGAIYTSLNNIVTVVADGQSFYATAELGDEGRHGRR